MIEWTVVGRDPMGPRRGVDGRNPAEPGRRRRCRGSSKAERVREGPASGGVEGLFLRGLLLTAISWFGLDRFSNGFFVGAPSGFCPLQQCWDAYHGELDTFRIREDFHSQPSSVPDHSRSTTEWRRLCSIYRSFSGCVVNATRDCVGDLNFHSTQRGVERKLAQYNCSVKDAGKRPETAGRGKEQEEEEQELEEVAANEAMKCNFQDYNISSYRHCSMYGDPHLRTFDGAFQTCRIQGAWPLVDNDFLTVQITSAPVGVGEGTSISEVTVVIKRNDSCALDRYVTYQAQNGELPGTFDNGLVEFNTVEIVEISPRLHIEIGIGYKQTVVIVRLIGLAYAVSVTFPEDVFIELGEGHGNDGVVHLCQSGCPLSERVDLNSYFDQKSSKLKRTAIMSKNEAIDRCRRMRLYGFYFDSCVYDLMTTGDSSFTGASYASYSDLLRFVPGAAAVRHRNLTPEKFDEIANSSGDLAKGTYGFRVYLFLVLIVHTCLHAILS